MLTTARLVFATTCVATVSGIAYIHYDQMISRSDLKKGIELDMDRQRLRQENIDRQKHNVKVEQAYRQLHQEQAMAK